MALKDGNQHNNNQHLTNHNRKNTEWTMFIASATVVSLEKATLQKQQGRIAEVLVRTVCENQDRQVKTMKQIKI